MKNTKKRYPIDDEITYLSPVGKLWIGASENRICTVSFSGSPDTRETSDVAVLNTCINQLKEYFRGERQIFDLPLSTDSSPFERRVWEELRRIPYGATRSYKQLAAAIGCSNGCRAVGNANGHNPIAIIIPCHRVIASNGTLGGYTGGLFIKKHLLRLEASHRTVPSAQTLF